MKNRLLTLFTAAAMLFAQTPAWTESDFKTLDKYSSDGSSVRVTLSGQAKFNAFKISNPPRLVIEFTNTEFNAPQKELAVNSAIIKRVRGNQYQNQPVKISRIVVELNRFAEYELKGNGNEVRLSFVTPAAASSTKPSATAEKPKLPEPPSPAVTASTKVKPAEKPAAPVAKAPAPLPDAVSHLADPGNEQTAVAPAPVQMKVQEPAEADVVPTVIAQPSESVIPQEAEAPRDEPESTSAAAPAVRQEAAPGKDMSSLKTVLPRKPITFDFEEADIRDVFRILSLKSGINIIYGPDIAGTVTLRLENVPFDKAFQTILSLKGFVSQDEGNNILRIMTFSKVTEERAQAVTYSRIYPLNYAKAEEIKANLDNIRNAEGRRGNISVDSRTNSLIITDTPEGLLSMERLINDLDKKPDQVVIEAKIVELSLNKATDLGIQWQYAGTVRNDADQKIYIGASKGATSDTVMGPNGVAGSVVSNPITTADGGTGVTFPASAVGGQISSISFGILNNGNRLNGILTALAQKGQSKLLSSPKVTTINNKEAKILVGQKIPYTTTTVTNSGTTQSTSFLDVGIKLTVTPTINADRKISLQVHPEVSLYIRADPAGPVIGTREALTTVIVNNGETAVIGGLITDDDRKTATSVPLMGDLPIIGHLFKRDYKSKDRTELLVFITPQIIN